MARASPKVTKEGQILTPMQLYSWANKHVTGIFVSKQDIAEHSLKIEPRLQNAKTVVGTRSHHRFIPLADNKLRMHHLSMDQIGTVVQVGVHASSISMSFPIEMELKLEMYVAVISGMLAALQIGQIFLVNCMHQSTNFLAN